MFIILVVALIATLMTGLASLAKLLGVMLVFCFLAEFFFKKGNKNVRTDS